MIQIKALNKSYGQKQVLHQIQLQWQLGQVHALIGPNGCGKSTIVKSILGLVVPNDGDITWNGNTILGQSDYRKDIGYVPQNPDFPENLTVQEIFELIESLRKQVAVDKDRWISTFQLEKFLQVEYGHLSGGTKQKVNCVLAFMFDPQLLILDEPTNGLDPRTSLKLKDLILKKKKKGKTIVLVSHQLSDVEALADQVHFVLDGKVLVSGSKDEIKTRTGTTDLERAVVSLLEANGRN